MKKTIIALLLNICIALNCVPIQIYATENMENNSVLTEQNIDNGVYTIGNNITINHLLEQAKFTTRQGHGFAAEIGNNLIDQIKGNKATIVGNNNIKNGADRLIIARDGSKIWIQDKYYNTAKASIDACFENNTFRYLDADGNAMLIEVPRDQYDDAIRIMKKRIENGHLKNAGITDPSEAESLVKQGSLTYKQAVNLAKAGTIESLTYDAVNGTISASCSFGISALLIYSVSRLNGNSSEESLKTAAIEGLKSGGITFGTSVIASQLSKTNMLKQFVPTSEALVKSLGDDFASALLNSVGKETVGLTDDAIRNQAAKILRNQALTAGVTVVLLTVDDVISIMKGRISAKQLIKNLAVSAAGVAGGYIGSVIGGAAGSFIAPGAGTTAGSVIGGVVVGGAASLGTEVVLGIFIEDDAETMMKIIEMIFLQLSQDYLLSENEATHVADALTEILTGTTLENMFASQNQYMYAQKIIEPLIKNEIENREIIIPPTDTEMRTKLKTLLEGVVFIH